MPDLTTTSYAVLGLLGVRSWTAYELTQQMTRSMSPVWPRAVSAIYREPKNLVAHGLATAVVEDAGERRRTRYSITSEGRLALEQWLAQPSAPPQLESESLVRVTFAEQGTKEDLLKTLGGLRDEADELASRLRGQLAGYLENEGPFPQRMHIHSLVGPFCIEYAELLSDWARRAEEEVGRWPDVSAANAPRGEEIIRSFLHKGVRRRAGPARSGRDGDDRPRRRAGRTSGRSAESRRPPRRRSS